MRRRCALLVPRRRISFPFRLSFQPPVPNSVLFTHQRWCSSSSSSPIPSLHPSERSIPSSSENEAEAEDLFLSQYVIPADAGRLYGTPHLLPSNPADEVAFKKKLIRTFPMSRIRNVSIVAHVDHGKTTLTDAMLRFAGLLPPEGATGTFTDRLQVEKDRGITIKAQTCSIFLTLKSNTAGKEEEDVQYLINLIDTPGHVDFQYEVSRSLCACEGAALLVDVRQGVEAQTMAQFYAAMEQNLSLIPVLTKMDGVMNDTQVAKVMAQLEDSTGLLSREVVLTSAKAKKGVEALYQHILDHVPPPQGREGFSDLKQLPLMHPESEERKKAEEAMVPLRALLFDCWTAESGGISAGAPAPASSSSSGGAQVASDGIYGLIRVMDGTVTPGTVVTSFHSRQKYDVRDVGLIHPTLHPAAALTAGMVGYVFLPGLTKKDVMIGDTLCTLPTRRYTLAARSSDAAAPAETENRNLFVVGPIPGFKQVQPVVFAGFYPDEGESIGLLRNAVDVLCINDPSVTVESMQCPALGPGLQLGFLGLLHMQVFKERLLLEMGQSVLVTPPQVQYMCVEQGGDVEDPTQRKPISVTTWRWMHEGVAQYLEPVVMATVITPSEYFNTINGAALSQFRGTMEDMRVVDDARTLVRYRMPLADLARGFFTTVKSASHGYATLDYDDPDYVAADLVKIDIVINKARIAALSTICPRHAANEQGKRIISSLKENLLRSSVDLPLQALIGGKIIARETVKAYRKDVTAKIHAGDISRKQKKWNDQKKGKERMARRSVGTVTLDQSVLAAAMGATTMK